jgi:hypothetical protein
MSDAECEHSGVMYSETTNSEEGVGAEPIGTGDIDGDGVAEVVMGRAFSQLTVIDFTTGSGCGSEVVGIPTLDLYFMGRHVDLGSDVDGDGTADLVAGVYSSDHQDEFVGTIEDAGVVYIFTGLHDSTTGWAGTITVDEAHANIGSTTPEQYFGWDAAVGDVDGDGVGDLVATYKGGLGSGPVLFYGPVAAGSHTPSDGEATFTGDGSSTPWYFANVNPVGDHNGDGYADFLVGNPNPSSLTAGGGGTLYLYHGATN